MLSQRFSNKLFQDPKQNRMYNSTKKLQAQNICYVSLSCCNYNIRFRVTPTLKHQYISDEQTFANHCDKNMELIHWHCASFFYLLSFNLNASSGFRCSKNNFFKLVK